MEITSSLPHCVQVNFSPFPLQKIGEEITISEAGMALFNPESKYVLPDVRRIGDLCPVKPVRARRTNFPTQGQLNLRIKCSEVKANENRKLPKADNFTGTLNFININKGKDAEAIVITDVTCEWRFAGEKEWKPVNTFEMEKNFSLFPMRTSEISYYVTIEDKSKSVGWFNRSWVGRNQTIRFKFTFEDVESYISSQIVEYVFKPPDQYGMEKDDQLFLCVDQPELYDRAIIRGKNIFNPEYPTDNVFSVDGNNFNVEKLTELVFKAKEESNYEQSILKSESEGISKKAWALIDANTNRVYAVKALVTNANSAAMGYFPVELYGKPAKATKPNKPATEVVEFPNVTLPERKTFVQDDDFDDALIPCVKPTATSGGNVMSLDTNSLSTLNHLNENMKKMADTLEKFDSVDKSITRLADSFEKIVVILSNKK